MRYGVLGLTVLALAGCGRAPDSVSESGDAAAPGIAVTAAPGVAFNYRYAFRLPAAAIAATQEAHAGACERLGIARCRITGMRYRLVGENDIEAMLAFKLDPAIAREFGRRGVLTAEQAKGRLVDAEITGTDAGAAAAAFDAQRAEATDALARLDRDIAAARSGAERAELQRRRAEIADRIGSARAGAAEQRASLATTPVTFGYESGPAVRGFDTSAPLTSALDTAVASAQATLVVVLGLFAIAGPPALALLLLWLAWRALAPRWRRARQTEA
jgi:hypothetical protein